MLGSIGFFAAGLLFTGYALAITHSPATKAINRSLVATAYALLAVACLAWATGALAGNESVLRYSVLVGTAMVVAGSVCLLAALTKRIRSVSAIILALVVGTAFAIIRWHVAMPDPYIDSDVLVFNSPRYLALAYIGIFGLVWLPVTVRYIRQSLLHSRYVYLTNAGITSVAMAVVAVYTFISAATVRGITISFVFLCLAFLPLLLIAYLRSKEASHGK